MLKCLKTYSAYHYSFKKLYNKDPEPKKNDNIIESVKADFV